MGDRSENTVRSSKAPRWLTAGIVAVLLGTIGMATTADKARAQAAAAPSAVVLETLIKRYLLAFNHANLTGNYAVFHALLHPRFSSRFSPDQLSEIFTVFRRKKVDLGIIATMKPHITPPPRVDDQGRLQVTGWFPTRPSRVLFRVIFRRDGRTWKLTSIRVSVKRPNAGSDGGKVEKL